ncbi:hypothetical protein [Natrarchaeobaculum aegyptiacum]|uniref:Uncharacterized protein n=1 Tax=Natrarchaeobaculum aegyptiacum TaxID=745377 RepID=A0A2Z2HVR4_9EURY|nr:hypothetical protein [Natrarchaeobaculum aegyptiacum]ARS91389.1 hypothetical protein B1756_17795 [Natrarchaeobaculum aegyptiacum]
MAEDSKRITGGFLTLVVGLLIVLAGVFLGGNLVVMAVGGLVGLLGVSALALGAFALEAENGSHHDSSSSGSQH